MNREDFIAELINYYEDFTEENTPKRVKAYKLVLTDDPDYDYNELWLQVLKNHTSFKFAPTPAHLLQLIKNKYESFF